jgi:hypothetical protein
LFFAVAAVHQKIGQALRAWPIATERDGAQWCRFSRGSFAEGGSAGGGKSIQIGLIGCLIPAGFPQAALKKCILRPLPDLTLQLLATIGRSVYLTLGEHKLPKTRFIEFGFNNFHTRSSFDSISDFAKFESGCKS